MIKMNLSQIAAVTQGCVVGNDVCVEQVSRDSRQETKNGLFVAIKGERFDAHHFIGDAIDVGAIAAITEKEVAGINQVVVDDAIAALQQIAVWQRQQVSMHTVAITGSCGKTTVKGMLAAICQGLGATLVTPGNYNNHIGVPLTLLELKGNEEFGVIELGANHVGEIKEMVSWVQPDVALINCIAGAHLEGFGSIENIAKAKGEIYTGLAKGGIAVYPSQSEYTQYWKEALHDKEVITFGFDTGAFVRADNVQFGIDKSEFDLTIAGSKTSVTLNLGGKHNIHNALAAAACAYAVGISLEQIRKGLASFEAVEGRSHHQLLANGFELINDSYNANEASFRAAIDLLGLVDDSRQKVMIMGEMGELGEYAEKIHHDVGTYANQFADILMATGPLTKFAIEGFGDKAFYFETKQQLLKKLDEMNLNNTTVLVKGSRSSGMEQICTELELRFRGEQ